MPEKLPSVFIGSSTEGLDVAREIELQLQGDAATTIWKDGVFGLGSGVLESLMNAIDQFDFAIMVLSPDDLLESRSERFVSPRDNVIFELGLFMGRLGRTRTFIVHEQDANLKLPTDLAGITVSPYRKRENLSAALSPTCTPIIKRIRSLGFVEHRTARQILAVAQEQQEQKSIIEQQQSYLDVFFAILANLLSQPEKFHLRALARGGERYEGRQSLREELLRLKRFGLIKEVPGQKIGDIFDGKFVDPGAFIALTDSGKKFIEALDKIESQ